MSEPRDNAAATDPSGAVVSGRQSAGDNPPTAPLPAVSPGSDRAGSTRANTDRADFAQQERTGRASDATARDDVDRGSLDADTMELPARSDPDAARRGQRIDSDPQRRTPEQYPAPYDRGQDQRTVDYGTRDPIAYRGSAGVPVAPPAAGATTPTAATTGLPADAGRGVEDDDRDAGLDIGRDNDEDALRPRRRGQGWAGVLGVVGLSGAAFGLFALPLQSRLGEVFYGELRQIASRADGLLLRVNASGSTPVGNEFARFVWRSALPVALGVCAVLLVGVLCWPFMRKAAGVLLAVVALVTGIGLVLGAHGTYEFRPDGSHRSALGLIHWGIGAYVGLGGLFVLFLAGVIAGVQSRE